MTSPQNEFTTEYDRVQPSSVVEKSQSYQAFGAFRPSTTDFSINFMKIERIERFESLCTSQNSQNLSNHR